MSLGRIGKKFPKHGDSLRGRPLSEDTKHKMSVARKGRQFSPETRAKLSAALTGRIFTPEWKAKIRAAKRGKPWSEQRRRALVEKEGKILRTSRAVPVLLASMAERATPLHLCGDQDQVAITPLHAEV